MPKINQLPAAGALSESDILAVETANGSNTRAIRYANLRAQIQNDSMDVFASVGSVASDEQVADAVSAWLDEHTEESDIVVDDTLSISGAAADAKVTGDKFEAVDDILSYDANLINTGEYYVTAGVLVSGVWNWGRIEETNLRARNRFLFPVQQGMRIEYTNITYSTLFGVLATPSTYGSYLQSSGWTAANSSGTFSINNDGYLVIDIKNGTDDTQIVDPAVFDGTIAILVAEDKEERWIMRNLTEYNAIDIFDGLIEKTDSNYNGVYYSWNGDVCTITTPNGPSTGDGSVNVLIPLSFFPSTIIPGEVYYVHCSTTHPLVRLRIVFRTANDVNIEPFYYFAADGKITVPADAAKWTVTLYVNADVLLEDPAIVSNLHFLPAKTNKELSVFVSDLSDIVDGLSTALVYRDSTEINQASTIFDLTSGCYFEASGAKIKQLIDHDTNSNVPSGNVAPKGLVDLVVYSVRLWKYTNSYIICEIVSTKGSPYFIGATAISHPNVINWYECSYKKNDQYGAINIFEDNYRRVTEEKYGIHYEWTEDECKVYGQSDGNISVCVVYSLNALPDYITSETPMYLTYKTTNPKVQFRLVFRETLDGPTTMQYYTHDSIVNVPENAHYLSAGLYVAPGANIGSESSGYAIVSDILLFNAKTNQELSIKSNALEHDRPLYVAIGASTTQGAVHYYDPALETSDKTRISIYNYPTYVGSVLGLKVVNLAVGGSGFIARVATRNVNGTYYYDDNNYMDVIFNENNRNLFANANLITITTAYGNDANLKLGPADTRTAMPIGEYNDYYPYDEEGYHPSDRSHTPSDGQTAVAYMIENKGATFMGCINWCLKYLGEHYPLAQVIAINGRTAYNTGESEYGYGKITVETDSNGKKSLNIKPRSYVVYSVEEKVHRIMKEINIPYIDICAEGMPYSYYGSEATDANGDYILFSTIKKDGVKVKNNHPTDAGYLLFARYLAGRIASYYYR